MLCLLPSEIARLVLSYLEEENLTATYNSFLNECKYLEECKLYLKRGLILPRKIHGKTLSDYLVIEDTRSEFKIEKSVQTDQQNDVELTDVCLKRKLDNITTETPNSNSHSSHNNEIFESKYQINQIVTNQAFIEPFSVQNDHSVNLDSQSPSPSKKKRLLIGKNVEKNPVLSVSSLQRELTSTINDAVEIIKQEMEQEYLFEICNNNTNNNNNNNNNINKDLNIANGKSSNSTENQLLFVSNQANFVQPPILLNLDQLNQPPVKNLQTSMPATQHNKFKKIKPAVVEKKEDQHSKLKQALNQHIDLPSMSILRSMPLNKTSNNVKITPTIDSSSIGRLTRLNSSKNLNAQITATVSKSAHKSTIVGTFKTQALSSTPNILTIQPGLSHEPAAKSPASSFAILNESLKLINKSRQTINLPSEKNETAKKKRVYRRITPTIRTIYECKTTDSDNSSIITTNQNTQMSNTMPIIGPKTDKITEHSYSSANKSNTNQESTSFNEMDKLLLNNNHSQEKEKTNGESTDGQVDLFDLPFVTSNNISKNNQQQDDLDEWLLKNSNENSKTTINHSNKDNNNQQSNNILFDLLTNGNGNTKSPTGAISTKTSNQKQQPIEATALNADSEDELDLWFGDNGKCAINNTNSNSNNKTPLSTSKSKKVTTNESNNENNVNNTRMLRSRTSSLRKMI